MQTSDIRLENLKVKCVVYGASGTGKTRFASTFPKPFFADFDDGMLSLRGRQGVGYETYLDKYRGGIRYQSAWKQFEALTLSKAESGLLGDRETLVIDSFTLASASCLADIAELNKRQLPSWDDYGKAVGPLSLFMKRIRALPYHVVIIAHEELVKIEQTGEVVYIPLLYGKVLGPLLEDLFDEVYRAVTTQGKDNSTVYRLQTQKEYNVRAKSRIGCLSRLEEPDFGVIFEKMRKEETEKKGVLSA